MSSRPLPSAPPGPAAEPGRTAPAGAPRVDVERLKRDVLALGEIGRDPDDRGL